LQLEEQREARVARLSMLDHVREGANYVTRMC
jgi:hypothetical protein